MSRGLNAAATLVEESSPDLFNLISHQTRLISTVSRSISIQVEIDRHVKSNHREERMRVMPAEISGNTRLAQVCTHVMAGATEKDIAQKVGLSTHTVHAHIKQIYRITGVRSRPELLAKMMARLAERVSKLESDMISGKAAAASPLEAIQPLVL